MSSIAIGFDGLVLLLALAYAAIGYGVIAAIAAMRRETAAGARSMALRAGLFSLGTLLCFALVLAWWGQTGSAPRPGLQLDHLLWPWLAIFCFGCLALLRASRR